MTASLLEFRQKGQTDVLLWAQGRTGNVSELGLDSIGITPTKRGTISVNEVYQTPNTHISMPLVTSPVTPAGQRGLRPRPLCRHPPDHRHLTHA